MNRAEIEAQFHNHPDRAAVRRVMAMHDELQILGRKCIGIRDRFEAGEYTDEDAPVAEAELDELLRLAERTAKRLEKEVRKLAAKEKARTTAGRGLFAKLLGLKHKPL